MHDPVSDIDSTESDHAPLMGTPRWVLVCGVIALVLLILVIGLLLFGGGLPGGHGPGRH
jgi:hypothetical protein